MCSACCSTSRWAADAGVSRCAHDGGWELRPVKSAEGVAVAMTRVVFTADGRARESLAIGVAGVASVVSIVAALLAFRLESAPIAGPGSVGQFAAIAATVAAIVVFVFGRYVVRDRQHSPRLMDLVDLGVVALAHAVIALLSWTLLSAILARSFAKAVV